MEVVSKKEENARNNLGGESLGQPWGAGVSPYTAYKPGGQF